MTNREWFKQAQFGLMIHWGLYSILGGEWKGQRMDYIGEWIQSKYEIPNNEYEKLATIFNPIYFDAEEWVLLAKEAGMQYIVFTSKHYKSMGDNMITDEYYSDLAECPTGLIICILRSSLGMEFISSVCIGSKLPQAADFLNFHIIRSSLQTSSTSSYWEYSSPAASPA